MHILQSQAQEGLRPYIPTNGKDVVSMTTL
jgi:hypothetical protein